MSFLFIIASFVPAILRGGWKPNRCGKKKLEEIDLPMSRRVLIKQKSIMNYSKFTAPLFTLTVEEYIELLDTFCNNRDATKPVSQCGSSSDRPVVYGLKGICDLFGCSRSTAQRLKDGILKDAVYQCGRKIVVDVDRAKELFNQKKRGNDER